MGSSGQGGGPTQKTKSGLASASDPKKEPNSEESKTGEPKSEEPKAEEPKSEEPKTEEAKAENEKPGTGTDQEEDFVDQPPRSGRQRNRSHLVELPVLDTSSWPGGQKLLRRVYKALCLACHPDKKKGCEEDFLLTKDAYERNDLGLLLGLAAKHDSVAYCSAKDKQLLQKALQNLHLQIQGLQRTNAYRYLQQQEQESEEEEEAQAQEEPENTNQ